MVTQPNRVEALLVGLSLVPGDDPFLVGAIIIRIHGPVRLFHSSTVPQFIEYPALYSNMCIYCTRYLYDISRRDPSFSYVHIFAANVCNTISVCCQLNFQVVSDHTRPCMSVSVSIWVWICWSVCVSSILYLAVYQSVFICRFVCLAVVFNCIQILSFLASRLVWRRAAGTGCATGEQQGTGWAALEFPAAASAPMPPSDNPKSETGTAQRETKTETETETEARFRPTTDPHNLHFLFFSLSLHLPVLSLYFSWFTSVFFVRSCRRLFWYN